MALHVINKLGKVFLNLKESTTDKNPLPGATYLDYNFQQYTKFAKEKYNWLPPKLLDRLLHQYGTKVESILNGFSTKKELGIQFSSYLYQCEVDYLVKEEWVEYVEDLLWRRSKLGLDLSQEEQYNLSAYLNASISR